MQKSSIKSYGLIIAVLVVGIVGAVAVVKTAPSPQKKSIEVQAPLVEVKTLEATSLRPSWVAGGSANASAKVALVAQVAGQISEVSSDVFPGRFLTKGSTLAKVDDANYRQNLIQRKAAVVQAQANVDMEKGQAQQALNNYKLSGLRLSKQAKALALRKPQLASAQAALSIAKADLAKAKLDLERSTLRMPFDGYVLKQHVSLGAFVNSNTQVFELVASDEFWIEVKVPQSFADILDLNEPVKVHKLASTQLASAQQVSRKGKVLSILPSVDASDRQVKVLISIESPLTHPELTVRYGEYVQITLFAKPFENALLVNSQHVNDDQSIWLVNAKQQLSKRPVKVLYSSRDQVWLQANVQPQESLLLNSLPSNKEGMAVRINNKVQSPSSSSAAAQVSHSANLAPASSDQAVQ